MILCRLGQVHVLLGQKPARLVGADGQQGQVKPGPGAALRSLKPRADQCWVGVKLKITPARESCSHQLNSTVWVKSRFTNQDFIPGGTMNSLRVPAVAERCAMANTDGMSRWS